jgi:hypothetical protein
MVDVFMCVESEMRRLSFLICSSFTFYCLHFLCLPFLLHHCYVLFFRSLPCPPSLILPLTYLFTRIKRLHPQPRREQRPLRPKTDLLPHPHRRLVFDSPWRRPNRHINWPPKHQPLRPQTLHVNRPRRKALALRTGPHSSPLELQPPHLPITIPPLENRDPVA